MKSGETLMEVRSDSDVQIDRQILIIGGIVARSTVARDT
ncbi:unnamed protein product, partial [Didymodactylos carnosus]